MSPSIEAEDHDGTENVRSRRWRGRNAKADDAAAFDPLETCRSARDTSALRGRPEVSSRATERLFLTRNGYRPYAPGRIGR
jgi:hypothetical protein